MCFTRASSCTGVSGFGFFFGCLTGWCFFGGFFLTGCAAVPPWTTSSPNRPASSASTTSLFGMKPSLELFDEVSLPLGAGTNRVIHAPFGTKGLADLAHRAACAQCLPHRREQIR